MSFSPYRSFPFGFALMPDICGSARAQQNAALSPRIRRCRIYSLSAKKSGDFAADKVPGVRKNGTREANGHRRRYSAKMAAKKNLTDTEYLNQPKAPETRGKMRK